MLFSVFYLSLFLSVGLLSARRAVPDGSAAVIVPLGCGFGVSLLAVLPALFAVVLGFTLPAAALAAPAAAGIGAALLYRGTRLRGMAKDPDSGALWACLLPVVLITLYLLHTHVLHLVDGAYHTGQSCYGDMPMHLGFIKYIAQSGEFLPRYPLLGGTHRFGYPFLCETVSSVFVVLGADLRTAYLLPMLPAFLSVYGMFWQLARRVTDSAGKACLAFYLFFMGSGFGFAYFLKDAATFKGIFYGQRAWVCVLSRLCRQLCGHFHGVLHNADEFCGEKHRVGQSDCGSAYPPAGDAVWLVRAAARRLSSVAVLL